MTPCEVDVRRGEDGWVVVVSGEVDMSCAPALRERLLEVVARSDPGESLVVDLEDVSFLDSTGLGVLVGANRRLTAAGATMTVVASEAARRPIHLAGLDQLWTVVDPP